MKAVLFNSLFPTRLWMANLVHEHKAIFRFLEFRIQRVKRMKHSELIGSLETDRHDDGVYERHDDVHDTGQRDEVRVTVKDFSRFENLETTSTKHFLHTRLIRTCSKCRIP